MIGSRRDAAREELAKVLYRDSQQRDLALRYEDAPHWTFQADAVLAWMESRGYRRSVTPDQIEAVAELIYDVDHGYQFSERGLEFVRKIARAFGLEVTE